MEEIWRLFPKNIAVKLQVKTEAMGAPLEEIRLRTGSQVELVFLDQVIWLHDTIFTENDSMYLLNQLSEHSLYRMQQELREGYMTTKGGHRVGLAGAVTTESGTLKQLQHIAFFNIRIAKELKNIAQAFLPYLRNGDAYRNTLLIGAPQTGKTTILRDLVRLISNGGGHHPAKKVGIVDERSEIAAAYKGRPQHDIGKRTDVMDACPKADGLMMMIRSMSPDVLIADEIGGQKDVQALLEAITSGVTIMCTVHGDSVASVRKRPTLERLFVTNMFERFIVLDRKQSDTFFFNIIDDQGVTLNAGQMRSI